MRFLSTCVLALIATLTISGCATVQESLPPKTSTVNPTISFSTEMPRGDFLPELSATAPGTKYVLVQSGGGSPLLGPLLSSLSIAAKTQRMAEQYKDSLLSIDSTPIVMDALEKQIGVQNQSENAAYAVTSFVFVQQSYDDRFRLSLVLQVDGNKQSPGWVGRYTYHLPTSYPVSRFGNLSPIELANYRAEVTVAAEALVSLLKRDVTGNLPATGRRVNFGSLYLIGHKVGGLGIYTMPEEIFFPNAQVIEESDDYVTVRLKGNMHAPFGGAAFGVHLIDRKLVHTLKPV